MENIVFLIFRRMRVPLLSLVSVYALAVLGLTLIPGRDAAGNVWHMDLFHALYFVSFMSTTIGFGEIPYEFSDAQRLWVLSAMEPIMGSFSASNILTTMKSVATDAAGSRKTSV